MAGGVASIGAMGAVKSYAQTAGDYKALVMIFLKGGQDGADFIIPFDQPSWDVTAQHRTSLFNQYKVDQPDSSRNRANLLEMADSANTLGGRSYSLPPQLAPLHELYNSGELAVIGNVGPLIETLDRTQYNTSAAVLPRRLFSHNDQQSSWMTFEPEGGSYGWGGLFADAMNRDLPDHIKDFVAISAGSNDPFLSGLGVQPFHAVSSGAPELRLTDTTGLLDNTRWSLAAKARFKEMLQREDPTFANSFMRDINASMSSSSQQIELLAESMDLATTITTRFPNNSLGNQLKTVANMINVQQIMGVQRQVFFVTMGGFDTHKNQFASMPRLHTTMAQSLAAFKEALTEINKWDQTVTFTASDFGRTHIDNGTGTDHGWGNFHVAMGGAVRGGQYYGDFPEPDVNSNSFTPTRGRLIPGISVEQYAAPLGRWFGLDESELSTSLPNLGSFDSYAMDFVG